MKNKKALGLAGLGVVAGLNLAASPTIPPTPGVEDTKKITSDQVYAAVSGSPDSTLNTTSLFVENKPSQAELSAVRREAHYESAPYVANIVYADGTVAKRALESQVMLSDDPLSYIKPSLAKQKDFEVSIKDNITEKNVYSFKKTANILVVTVDSNGKKKTFTINLHGKGLSKKEKYFVRLAYKLILDK